MKKRLLGLATVAVIGMMLTGCDSGDKPPIEDGQPLPTGSEVPGDNDTPISNPDQSDSNIARVEDAPGPGELGKTDNETKVYTSRDYPRIKEWYGVDIISLANPYIQVDTVEDNPSVKSLAGFDTPENLEKVTNYASSNHSDWTADGEAPQGTTYLYYENGILSGIYPALKYGFGDGYILLDPVYDRLIDGSKQTLRAYLEDMIKDCTQGITDKEFVVEFKENDTICFAEGTSLKDALDVYCAYIDQGSSAHLSNLYGMDYRHRYVYGYTGDGFAAGYDAMGFSGVETTTSKFLNIYFLHEENDESFEDDREGYAASLFSNIDAKLAEAEIYPFYDKYEEEHEEWERNKDSYEREGRQEPAIEDFWKQLAGKKIEQDGKEWMGYGQKYLSKRRLAQH